MLLMLACGDLGMHVWSIAYRRDRELLEMHLSQSSPVFQKMSVGNPDWSMYELAACVAVCLQSSYTGDDVYILESFLPPDCQRRWWAEGTSGVYLWSDEAEYAQFEGISTRGDFGSPQLSDMPVTGNGFLKKADAQNPESRRCEM
jgi:hypothetical protein